MTLSDKITEESVEVGEYGEHSEIEFIDKEDVESFIKELKGAMCEEVYCILNESTCSNCKIIDRLAGPRLTNDVNEAEEEQ